MIYQLTKPMTIKIQNLTVIDYNDVEEITTLNGFVLGIGDPKRKTIMRFELKVKPEDAIFDKDPMVLENIMAIAPKYIKNALFHMYDYEVCKYDKLEIIYG